MRPTKRVIPDHTNENGARYRFAYDALDRLIAESGFDHKLTAYHYNAGNELTQQSEYGDDAAVAAKLMAQLSGQPQPRSERTPIADSLKDKTPLRVTEFKRDVLGRLNHSIAHDNKGDTQETVYHYDSNGNLIRAANTNSITCFDYNPNGQLIGQHQWKVPNQEEHQALGLPESDWRDPQYDMLYLPITQSIHYHYDFNGNRTTTVLPDGRQINHLYYGSGHLHQINLDGQLVSDFERDRLHREVLRTQGEMPQAVSELLPRLRDPAYTHVLIVTLPEATPVHEAERLQGDLARAGITPYAWVINQSLLASGTTDPLLSQRGGYEVPFIRRVADDLAPRCALIPWLAEAPVGRTSLEQLVR